MKRGLFFSVILYVLLLTASPALSTIMVNLENPGDMQDLSGIALVSGWAFSTMGAAVTVKPRIDGTTQSNVIPCCGPRADVQDPNVPGAPLNTGFGSVINYGAITAGPHTIGIEVSAPGETTVIVDHAVMTARPGNFEFLTSFSLAGANIAIDGNEIVIGGAQVGSSSGTATTNLRVNYATSSQSLVIGEAFNPNTALFNTVQSIFTANCAFSGCHAGPNPQQGQDLSQGQSFKNIVAVRSMENPSLLRINPGVSEDESYLYRKITGENIAPGTARMPFGCSGATCLSQSEIDTIENWILAGAPAASGSSSSSSTESSSAGGGGGGY
ncbi:MAG: hypothetical protein HYZ72_01845 [Deltaproteobacteria bacterium]|nr:hypothetical protein [Deltaproteobacteria bacterium]